MIVNRFISVKQIIESVYRDNGFQEELPWEDLIVWSQEALELIGAPVQYIKKVTGSAADPNLYATNYRAPLPCDFHKLVQIAVNGGPVRYSGDSFHHLLSGSCCNGTTNNSTETWTDNFGNVFTPQAGSLAPVTKDITFDINNDFITLSVKEADICLAYLAIPLDGEGFPMVPDDAVYKIAIRSYLTYKIDYIGWRNGRTSDAVFKKSEQEWLWYVGKASERAKLPQTVDEMESLKNGWLRLMPNIHNHGTFFRHMGVEEQRKIH
jgi:hypothetical protein